MFFFFSSRRRHTRCSRDWSSDVCSSDLVGAAFSFILDEKMTLGLAAPPPERVPVESLSEQELIGRAIEERQERGRLGRMTLKSAGPGAPWTEYTGDSPNAGQNHPRAGGGG